MKTSFMLGIFSLKLLRFPMLIRSWSKRFLFSTFSKSKDTNAFSSLTSCNWCRLRKFSNLELSKSDKVTEKIFCLNFVFPNVWPLDAKIGNFWPQIRILREISSLGPDSQVRNRFSSLKNVKLVFKSVFLLIRSWGYNLSCSVFLVVF